MTPVNQLGCSCSRFLLFCRRLTANTGRASNSDPKMSSESLYSLAERVVKRTRVDLKAGVAGDSVAVPVPLVGRGRGDPRNILGVTVNRNLDTDQYIAVKAGILNGGYSRNQFDLCPQLLTFDDVDQENHVSLRTAVTA